VLSWVIACMAAVSAEEISSSPYPYGIDIEISQEGHSLQIDNERCDITVTQQGKLVGKIHDMRCYNPVEADLNGDGKKEVVIKTFDGGRDFRLYVIPLRPHLRRIVSLPPSEVEFYDVEDVDKDGVKEIVSWTRPFSNMFLETDGAADIQIALKPDANATRLMLDAKATAMLHQQTPKTQTAYKPHRIYLDKEGYLRTDDVRGFADFFENVVIAFYSGKPKKAYTLMQKYLRFDHPAVRMLFCQDIAERLNKSPFFEDLVRINGWDKDMLDDMFRSIREDILARELFKSMD